jgi:tape measure domain-containing protein
MPSIDERVVAMSFENTVFEARVATTMATLGKLDASIKNIGQVNGLANIEASANKVTLQGPMSALDKLKAKLGLTSAGTAFSDMERSADKVTLAGPSSAIDKLKAKFGLLSAGNTFNNIEAQSDRVSLSGITKAIEGVASRFSTLRTAAAVALGGIVQQGVQKGAAFVKSFFTPIMDGFKEYQTNLASIQTILANTADSGGNLKTVNAALNELNRYSDKTIYNFSEMARNIGTFTAAGVQLKPAVAAIKGIANLAALSGSNSQQASTAMYQLSQAIAAGRVGLQDWNSVVNAGMGGAVFQKSLMRTAENMGTIAKGAVKIDKATGKATINGESFRNSIMAKPGQQSWLTSDVLTKTLAQFTGDLSDAQLKAQGFSDAEIKAIQNQAKMAQQAATQVKTLPQVFDVARETIGSGWATTFQTIFGNFNQSKSTFTALSNTINGFINTNSRARNQVLKDWAALGGRTDLINGIKNAFEAIMSILKPIKDAFRDIFPATTGKQLADLTKNFADLMASFKIGPATAENLRRTFAGLFAVLHIGWTIIKDVAKVLFDLLGTAGKGAGGILSFTGSIGDFLKALDNAISKGHALDGFFSGLTAILRVPLTILGALASAFFGLFDGVDPAKAKGVENSIGGVGNSLKPIKGVVDAAVGAWHNLVDVFDNLKTAVSPLLDNVANVFGDFGSKIAEGIKNTNFDLVFSAIQTTLIGGIFLSIKKALGGGIGIDIGGGLLGNLSKTFEALTGNLEAMQKNIQAKTLLTIAAAVGVLAASVVALSLIDPKKVASAMTTIAVGLGELGATLAILGRVTKGGGFASLPLISLAMVGLAASILILAGAMKIMSTMSWGDIAKGLVGVGGALAAVGAGMKLMGGGPGLVIQAAGLMLVAVALNALAVAMKIFGSMKWEDMAKGLVGIAGALTAIGLGMQLIGPEILLVAPGLLLAAAAITLLSGAIMSFGAMKWEDLAKGIIGMAGSLAALGLAIQLIPPTVALQAAGLVILAVALNGIAAAIKVMGAMNVEAIIKGITALAGVLLVLAIGLEAMAGTLPGSVALLAAAAAIAILAPAIALLGTLSWGTIIKGVVAIGAALGVLALVGALAATPLSALGVALLPLAAVFVLVAGAAYIFGKALALVGDSGPKAIAVMITAITAFVAAIPAIVINFLKGLVGIAKAVADVAPQVLLALGAMIDTIIAFVITEAPKLAVAIGTLVDAILLVLLTNSPKLIAAGVQLLMNLLSGISANIGQITTKVAEIVAIFLNTLASNMPQLVSAGVNVLNALIRGIASRIPALVATVGTLIVSFINAVASQIWRVVKAASNLIASFIGAISAGLGRIVRAGTSLIINFLDGVGNAIPRIINKGVELIGKFLDGISSGLVRVENKGADAVIRFLNGTANTIRNKGPELRAAGWNLASAIIEGLGQGIFSLGGKVMAALKWLADQMPGWLKRLLGIHSPSTVFAAIGGQVMDGLSAGIYDGSKGTQRTMEATAQDVVSSAKSAFGKMPNLLEGMMDTQPTITPVLDLSNVQKGAQQLSDLTNVTPITAAASYGQAAAISADKQAADVATAQAAQGGSTFEFNQYNTSPKALSEIEIYRQTNNQLSQIKRVVGLP